MKYFTFIFVAAFGLAACETTMQSDSMMAQSGMQLATQEDMSAIVGKTLIHDGPGQSFVISADGTLNGMWDGAPLVGTYEMRDGFFCRTLSQGPRGPSPEDCQLFILDGTSLMGTRDRGQGASFTYTVSG